jgi:hypothetical protein
MGEFINKMPNGTTVRVSAAFVADRMEQAATHLESLVSLLHNAGLLYEGGKIAEAKHLIECLASGIDADAKMREQVRRGAEAERMMQD